MADEINPGKTYRIIDINIASSVAGLDTLHIYEIIGLVASLYNNHATMGNPVMHFTPRHLIGEPDAITIVGIFDTDDQVAKTCICRFDELVEGAPDELGFPQLLYPHNIEIAHTVNLPTLIDHFWKALHRR